MDDRDTIARRRMEAKEREQMNNLTPEQLQQAGLEAVPWEALEDVNLNAWYRWKNPERGSFWKRLEEVWVKREQIWLMGTWRTLAEFKLFEHSTDNGKTWQPCHNIRPIGGRIEHEKLAVGGEVINKRVGGEVTNQTIFNLFSAMREGKVITVRGLLSSVDENRWGDAIELRSAMELVASVWTAIMFKGYSRIYIDGEEVDLTNETTMDNPSTSGHVARTPSANTGEI